MWIILSVCPQRSSWGPTLSQGRDGSQGEEDLKLEWAMLPPETCRGWSTDLWLQTATRNGDGEWLLMSFFWEWWNFLELDSSDGCTILQILKERKEKKKENSWIKKKKVKVGQVQCGLWEQLDVWPPQYPQAPSLSICSSALLWVATLSDWPLSLLGGSCSSRLASSRLWVEPREEFSFLNLAEIVVFSLIVPMALSLNQTSRRWNLLMGLRLSHIPTHLSRWGWVADGTEGGDNLKQTTGSESGGWVGGSQRVNRVLLPKAGMEIN